jgi:hypothetical protein
MFELTSFTSTVQGCQKPLVASFLNFSLSVKHYQLAVFQT